MNLRLLTETSFVRIIKDKGERGHTEICEDIEGAYMEFAAKVLCLYRNIDNYRELIAILLYTDTELYELSINNPNEAFLTKAIILVRKTLKNIRHEFVHSVPPAKSLKFTVEYKWTGNIADFVELVYALVESRSIEYGDVQIKELATYLGEILGLDIKNSYDVYTSTIKRRKAQNNSRAYYLDKIAYILNRKMDLEDGLDTPDLPEGMTLTLFD